MSERARRLYKMAQEACRSEHPPRSNALWADFFSALNAELSAAQASQPPQEPPADWEAAYSQFADGPAFPPEVNALKKAFAAGMAWQVSQSGGALRAIMRAADAAKEPCGMDPESPAAIRNCKFATIAQIAAQGLGLVRGPALAASTPPATQEPAAESVARWLADHDLIEEAERVRAAIAPQASQPPQGADIERLMGLAKEYAKAYYVAQSGKTWYNHQPLPVAEAALRAALAAPPQGASSLLPERAARAVKAFDELIDSIEVFDGKAVFEYARMLDVRDALAVARAASPLPAPQEPAAYLYQHDETGRTTLRLPDDRLSERRWHETPLYAAPAPDSTRGTP